MFYISPQLEGNGRNFLEKKLQNLIIASISYILLLKINKDYNFVQMSMIHMLVVVVHMLVVVVHMVGEVVDLGRTVVYQLLLQWVVVEVLLVFVSRDLYRVIAEVWARDSFGSS